MIRDAKGLEAWEREQRIYRGVDYTADLRWFNAAVDEAKALGAWRRADPWAGFWEKMRWIEALHRGGLIATVIKGRAAVGGAWRGVSQGGSGF